MQLQEHLTQSKIPIEIVEKRTQTSKVFDLGNGQVMHRIYTGPIHYEKDGRFENIDSSINDNKYTDSKGKLRKQKLMDKNRISVGFNDGLELEKFQGYRLGKDRQLELSFDSLWINKEKVDIKEFKNLKHVSNGIIEREINEFISLRTLINNKRATNLFYIKTPILNLRFIQRIHLKGIKLSNELVNNEYIPNSRGQFEFVDQNTEEVLFRFNSPQTWDSNVANKMHSPVKHKLYKVGDELFYEKYSDKDSEEVLQFGVYPIFFDAPQIIIYDSVDVRIDNGSSSTWSTVHDATSGTAIQEGNSILSAMSSKSSTKSSTCFVYRAFFSFNTSTLDRGNISSGSFNVYSEYHSILTPTISLQKGTQASTPTVDDFDSFSGTYYGTAYFNTYNQWYSITLDAQGVSDIDPNGVTKYCVREYDHDYLNVAPTGGTEYTAYMDSLESNYDPYLEITVDPILLVDNVTVNENLTIGLDAIYQNDMVSISDTYANTIRATIKGDIDGCGTEEVIFVVDKGSFDGIYYWKNNSIKEIPNPNYWKMDSAIDLYEGITKDYITPAIVALNYDGNGDKIYFIENSGTIQVFDFSTQTWSEWYNSLSINYHPRCLGKWDRDGDGKDEFLISFKPSGAKIHETFSRDDVGGWSSLSNWFAYNFDSIDYDGDNNDEFFGCFHDGSIYQGVWYYNEGWTQIQFTTNRPGFIKAGNFLYKKTVVYTAPGYAGVGTWSYNSGTSWLKFGNSTADKIYNIDLNNDGYDEFVGWYGPTDAYYSLWYTASVNIDSGWTQIKNNYAITNCSSLIEANINGVKKLWLYQDSPSPIGLQEWVSDTTYNLLHTFNQIDINLDYLNYLVYESININEYVSLFDIINLSVYDEITITENFTPFIMTVKVWKNGGIDNNWSSGSNWLDGTKPTDGDNVIISAAYNCVVNEATANLKSLDMNGYINTLSGSSNITVVGEAGSTVICRFAGTVTWTGTLKLNPPATAQINLTTAGATTFGGITIAGTTTGSVYLLDNTTLASNKVFTLTTGTLHTDGLSDNSVLSHSWGSFSAASGVRTLNLGNSNITISGNPYPAWDTRDQNNMTLTCGGSTITFTNTSATVYFFPGQPLTYNNVVFNTNTSNISYGNNCTIKNLTFNGYAGKTSLFSTGNSFNVTDSLNINGNSAINRFLMTAPSTSLQTASTITLGASGICRTGTTQYVDFRSIALAGGAANERDLSAITGLSGDCGGCSGITFTDSTDQHWVNTGGDYKWSTASNWTSRIPLPQDDVFMDYNFGASKTVSADMSRLGRDIDWSGASYTTSLIFSLANAVTSHGSLNLTGISSYSASYGWTFESQPRTGTITLTSNGKTLNGGFSVQTVGTTFRLVGDASSGGNNFALSYGTFIDDGYNFSMNLFDHVNNTPCAVKKTGTWTITKDSSGNVFTMNYPAAVTWSDTAGSIILSGHIGTGTKIFVGGGKTFNHLSITGGGTGVVRISSANTFNTLTIGGPKTVTFDAYGAVQTIGTFIANGYASNLVTLNSYVPGSAAVLTKVDSTKLELDYLNITDINVTPATTWFYGPNSNYYSGTGWGSWFNAPTFYDGITVTEDLAKYIDTLYINKYDTISITENLSLNLDVLNILKYDSITIREGDWNLTDTCVGHYKMNEVLWNDTPGEVIDSSGQGSHGRARNGAITVENGLIQRGGYFDGVNDYIRIDPQPSMYSSTGTIEIWYKYGGTPKNYASLILIGDGGWNNSLSIYRSTGGLFIAQARKGSQGYPYSFYDSWSGTHANDSEWQQLVIVQDGIAPKLYRNGKYDKTISVGNDLTVWSSYWTSSLLLIGYQLGVDYCNMFSDEVAIYNRPLTADEILARYNGHVGTEEMYGIRPLLDVLNIEVNDSIAITENVSLLDIVVELGIVYDEINITENYNPELRCYIDVEDDIAILENITMVDIVVEVWPVHDDITISDWANVKHSVSLVRNISWIIQ